MTASRLIPKTVHVGPYHLRVVVTNNLASDDAGEVVIDEGVIRIREDMTHDRQVEVLVHEIGHVHCSLAGFGFEEEVEEAVVARLATLQVDTFRKNPKLVAYIQEKPPAPKKTP